MGNIGRGFAACSLHHSGYEAVFADIVDSLIDKSFIFYRLNSSGPCTPPTSDALDGSWKYHLRNPGVPSPALLSHVTMLHNWYACQSCCSSSPMGAFPCRVTANSN